MSRDINDYSNKELRELIGDDAPPLEYVGIDPGLDGAIAVIRNGHLKIFDMPTLQVKSGKKTRRELNIAELWGILQVEICNVHMCVIEKVSSMPGQGVASTFKFGKCFGAILGLVTADQIPYELVTPQRWKKEMMQGMGKEKDASRMKALALFPQHSDLFARKKDHNRADAALMAEFAYRTFGRLDQ